MKIVTARELWHSSMTNIRSLVVPKLSSFTRPALPSLSGVSSENLGTILPPVAMAMSYRWAKHEMRDSLLHFLMSYYVQREWGFLTSHSYLRTRIRWREFRLIVPIQEDLKSNHLLMKLQRQLFLLSYLQSLSVGPGRIWTHDLVDIGPKLNQLSQLFSWRVACADWLIRRA